MSKNNTTSSIPHVCSALSNGDNQWHFNDQDKANYWNYYFASISTVNDEHTQLAPFIKLTENSLYHVNCTEHEIETTFKVLNPIKASNDDAISHEMPNGVSKSASKPLCILMNRSFDIWKHTNGIPIFINVNHLDIDQL